MSQAHQDDGFEFIRKMWGSMGAGLPGMVAPTLDIGELDRRIKDLQAVEGWLKMNLGMLQMTIQGLEMQRSTLATMQAMSQASAEGEGGNPFANPALWTWPFANTEPPASASSHASHASHAPAQGEPDTSDKPGKA